MATEAIVRNEFVGADDINPEDLKCPRDGCHSKTLLLYGTSQVTRIETVVDGAITDVKLDESSHAFEIEHLECLQCATRWHIKTREVMDLTKRCESLRQAVIDATGDDPYGIGKAN